MPIGPNISTFTLLSAGLAPPLEGEADVEQPRERKLRRAERHVAWMRDAVAAFVWLTVPWLIGRPGVVTPPFLVVILVGTLHTALAHAGYRRGWGDLRTRALVTSVGDATVVLGVLAASGGALSPLTPLLYVSMAAVAYRFELVYGLVFGTGYGLAYAGMVLVPGDLGVPLVDLVLRVGLLVATGMLASLSSESYLEAEVQRTRAQHTFEGILETVPGDVALIPRERALGRPGRELPLPRREVVEAAVASWMPPQAVQRTRQALARVFSRGETVEYEVTDDREGRTRAYRVLAGPLQEEDEVMAAAVVSTDVTKRKRAQRRLEDHARALRQSNRALARYASLTAHDLREPLRDIVRYLQRIERRDVDLDPESREELAFVIKRARRLDGLVGALHRFAEVDERPLRTERVDLEAIVEDVLQGIDVSKPPRLDVQTGDLATITADRRAIEAIVGHLIENAHQHAGRDLVHVWVDSRETEDGWRISVEDDGKGIPPRYHDRIFEPFRPRDRDPGSQHARMGLATVRRLVERLGGEIEVESEPGAGARFTFTVPHRSVLVDPQGREGLEAD